LRRLLTIGCVLVLAHALAFKLRAQDYADNLPVRHPAIRYWQSSLDDPITRLAKQLETGKAKLEYQEGGLGYLPSLLKLLGINSDSQALVFSKTSFQADTISPRNPRAIYFSDDVAVGWVRGGQGFELAALDPRQGIVFYTLGIEKTAAPQFVRRDVCLKCHQGPATSGVPGIFVGSVYPDPSGTPSATGAIVTDHRTAFEDRWGGWYVNARRGEQRDRANAVAPNPAEPEALETEGRQNLASFVREFDAGGYLTPISDIVALMTFEHQTQMTNLMTRLGWEARIAQHDGKGSAQIDADVEALVTYMLFAEEAPLHAPIEGVSSFAKTFPQRGPRDRQGRSLRDFDLQTRLFKHPLSYMIYSAAFDNLTPDVLQRVYSRLYEILTGKDRSEKFAKLSADDRKSILEIVSETKTSLPADWRPQAPGARISR
jgi:hypothetical protein